MSCAGRAETNAVVRIGATEWLRVLVGKPRNDRYLPLHAVLVDLLDAWRTDNPNDDTGRLITDGGRPLDRHRVGRIVRRVGLAAGIAKRTPTSFATPWPPRPSTGA